MKFFWKSLATCFIFVFISMLTSCGVLVNTNGNHIPFASEPPLKDSVIVIGRYDKIAIPVDTKLLGHTRIIGPAWMFRPLTHYSRLTKLAKREAQRLSGNVIQITDFHNLFTSSHFRSDIQFNVYVLSKAGLKDYRTKIATSKQARKDSIKGNCIVHLQVTERFKQYHVYFNNTLLEQVSSHLGAFPVSNNVYNIKLNERGTFSISPLEGAYDWQKVILKLGFEYYMVILSPPPQPHFLQTKENTSMRLMLITKDQFENDMWKAR